MLALLQAAQLEFTDTQTVRSIMATYKIQIDDVVRNATPAEVAEIEARQIEAEAQAEALEAKAAARQAVLDKLGLTADEAAALFG
jgi:hypothetical protein